MTRKSSILFQDIRSAIKWMALIFIFCFAHVTVYSQSMIDIDSMGYYLSLLNQNRSHDSALVVKAMDIVDVKILNDKQFSRADSIVEHFKIRLGNEYYYAFRYDLNCGLVLANQHSKAYRRILADISYLKKSDNKYLHYLLAQNFMELRVPIRNSDKMQEGIKLYLQWINEYEQQNDSVIVATLYHGLRGFYSTLGLIDKSFDTHKKCIQFISQQSQANYEYEIDFGPVMSGLQGLLTQQWIMGSVYIYFNKLKEGAAILYAAKDIYEKNEPLRKVMPFPELYLELLNYRSITHGDSIEYYRNACLIELKRSQDNPVLFAHYYEILAKYFYLNNVNDSSELFIRKSIFLQDSLQIGVSSGYGNLQTGYLYALIKSRQKKYKEAVPLLLMEIEQLKKANLRTEILVEYDLLANTYKAIGDYKNMSFVLEKYKSLNAIIINDEIKNRSLSFEIEQNILKQQKAAMNLSIENVKNRNAKYLFIGISFIVLIVSIVLIINVQLKRKVSMEKMRSQISRDLHDDIGSTLSSINIISNMAHKQHSKNADAKTQEILGKINERSQRLLDDMSDIVWSIKPENDTMEAILSRMRLYAATVLEVKGIDYVINFPTKNIEYKISLDVKNNLYLIFKEAVNNLAKYSECKNAHMSLNIENKNLSMMIQDNGVGFYTSPFGEGPEKMFGGSGIANMQKRAEEIKASFKIESELGKGTLVKLTVTIA